MSASPALPAPVWTLAAPASRADLLAAMRDFGVSAPLAGVLAARGLGAAALFPVRRRTPSSGIVEAARRVVQALRHEKRIRVHGDYDADGVSAAAVLVLGLRALGADVHGFIPHRLKEGYGVAMGRVEEHAAACDLLVTVDCGVSNVDEVRALTRKGVEVIVTDHHTPGPDFPDALVVHPQLTAGYDPQVHNLTGAGVAYHLLWAVREELGLGEPLEYAPLATLGTVADVAPLLGENRALVLAGLAGFPDTALPGLRALMGSRAADGRAVSVRDVSHVLAPRINAAGRMGEADLALELLTTSSERRAQELAQHLETRNLERRALQDEMFAQAAEMVDPAAPAIVLTRPGWHPGVMGIVASKLLERYYRPVYIVAEGKGSVRSTPGLSAVDSLRAAADLLVRSGGHPAAGGFTLRDGQFGALRRRLEAYAAGFPRPVPRVRLDAGLPLFAASPLLAGELETLEPFGEGLEAPTWHLSGELGAQKLVGRDGATLQYTLHGLRGVMFGAGTVRSGEQDVAAAVRQDTFRGQTRLELPTTALRSKAPLSLDGMSPDGTSPGGTPDAPPADLQRLPPRDGVGHLRGGARVYADRAVWDYLSGNIPGLARLEAGQPLSGEVVLYALPGETDLRRWLEAAAAGKGRLAFAWGPKTLDALETPDPEARLPEAQADAYRRWQWAHLYRHLDDAGWAQAVRAMLGVTVEAGPELAGVAD